MARPLVEPLAYWGTRIGMRLAVCAVTILPRRVVYAATDGIARAGYLLFRSFRNRSVRNLRLALGCGVSRGKIGRIARDSLKNFFRAFIELPLLLACKKDEIRNLISIAGCEYLDAALAKRKGVILVSAHLGNFFVLGTRLALSGYPTHVLINQPRDGRVARLMDDYRLQILQTTIHARPRHDALREITRVLRRNQIAIIIADEYRTTGSGIRVPFFGRPVLARRGPVTLALRTGAAIVPAYVIRDPHNKLQLIIQPEIDLVRAERDQAEILENTLRLTNWLEKTVRAYPDQWNWMTVKWEDGGQKQLLAKEHHLEQLTP